MITIFTTAKPFIGQIKVNQINALKSWQALAPDIEIILFGSGEGYAEVAKELGIVRIPEVETSEQGTPLVNSMFALAQVCGHYPVQMYVNCDIILLDDFLPAIQQIKMERFLAVGQRWDIDLNQEIDFDDAAWRQLLTRRVRQHGSLHPPSGSDYSVYKGRIWGGLPKLVVGRGGYDNELIYHCRASGLPVIDVSDAVTAVHQNHDYDHHPRGVDGVWNGPEAQLNYRAARDSNRGFVCTLIDADWRLSPDGLVRNYRRGGWRHYLQFLYALRRETTLGRLLGVGRTLLRAVRRIRSQVGRLYGAGRRQ